MNNLEAITSYFNSMTIYNKKSTNTIHKYLSNCLITALDSLEINSLNEITFETGYKLVHYYKNSGSKNNSTINKILLYLKRIIKHYEINSSFLKFKLLPIYTNGFKRLYKNDLKAIINYVKVMNFSKNSLVYKTMVLLLLDSGIRISELLNIKISNIDLDMNDLKIYLEETKTGKQRYAPFSSFSYSYIKDLINLDPKRDYLFINVLKNRRLNKNDVRLFYKRLSKKLHIDRIHSHRFRKTFASVLVENGMTIETLQNLIGHSRVSTTMLYVQFKESKALREYKNFNDWGLN